jgi:chromosome partitioning protein
MHEFPTLKAGRSLRLSCPAVALFEPCREPLVFLGILGKEWPVRIITIINQKGGCGKTTTAINLAGTFAKQGLRTLLVDMDPQSHCAAGLGVPENRIDLDIGDAMLTPGNRPLDTSRLLWRVGRRLDLAPSRMKLAGLEAARGGLADKPDKERRLHNTLQRFKADYDVSVIDCSPSIGLLTFNALAAADAILIPVETSYFALQGAAKQINTVRTLAKRLGIEIPIWILATIHDQTSRVSNDILGELQRRFDERVIPVIIRRDPVLREAASFGQPAIEFAPHSLGSQDYAACTEWFIEHGGLGLMASEPLLLEQKPVHVDAAVPVINTDEPELLIEPEEEAIETDAGSTVQEQSETGTPIFENGTAIFAGDINHKPQADAASVDLDASEVQTISEVKPVDSNHQAVPAQPIYSAAARPSFVEPTHEAQVSDGSDPMAADSLPEPSAAQVEMVRPSPAELAAALRHAMMERNKNAAQNPQPVSVAPITPSSLIEGHGIEGRISETKIADIRAAAAPRPLSRAAELVYRAQKLLRRGVAETPAPHDLPYSPAPRAGDDDIPLPTPLRLVESLEVKLPAAMNDTTRRLLGVRQTGQGILFVQPLTAGDKVCIAGTWNNWSPELHQMKRNDALGVYELCLRLEPGRHQYRLVLDGQWTADPHNESAELNPFGEATSIIEVAANVDPAATHVQIPGHGHVHQMAS